MEGKLYEEYQASSSSVFMSYLEFIEMDLMHQRLHAKKDEWISVADRLPEKSEDVLVYEKPNRDIGYYTEQFDWQTYGGQVFMPTHWMPLPKPPQCRRSE